MISDPGNYSSFYQIQRTLRRTSECWFRLLCVEDDNVRRRVGVARLFSGHSDDLIDRFLASTLAINAKYTSGDPFSFYLRCFSEHEVERAVKYLNAGGYCIPAGIRLELERNGYSDPGAIFKDKLPIVVGVVVTTQEQAEKLIPILLKLDPCYRKFVELRDYTGGIDFDVIDWPDRSWMASGALAYRNEANDEVFAIKASGIHQIILRGAVKDDLDKYKPSTGSKLLRIADLDALIRRIDKSTARLWVDHLGTHPVVTDEHYGDWGGPDGATYHESIDEWLLNHPLGFDNMAWPRRLHVRMIHDSLRFSRKGFPAKV